jgi:hypothetical protein
LKDAHVAGRSARFSRDDLLGVMRGVVDADADALLGVPAFAGLTLPQTATAMETVFGWDGDGPRARVDPKLTMAGFTSACARVLEVARVGGRIVFATARPASLLAVYRALARAAANAGGKVLDVQAAPIDETLRIWWIDNVAMVSDGEALLGEVSIAAAQELLFVLPQPDLVVGDHAFAGVALGVGLEVVALADLDAVALAVAAWRGKALRVAPFDQHRTPAAYAPLLDLLAEEVARPSDPLSIDVAPPVNRPSGRSGSPTTT